MLLYFTKSYCLFHYLSIYFNCLIKNYQKKGQTKDVCSKKCSFINGLSGLPTAATPEIDSPQPLHN